MRRTASLIGAVTLVGAMSVAPGYATTDSASAGADDADTLTITDVSDPVLDVGEDLTLTVAYTNNGTDPVTVTDFELYAQSTTAISDTSVYNWMSGQSPARYITSAPADLRVLPDHTMNLTFTIGRDKLPWDTAEFTWGPRGIEVRAVSDSEANSDRTMIVVATDVQLSPYPATVVVPVTDPGVVDHAPANELLWHEEPAADEPEPTEPAATAEFVSNWDHAGVTMLADPNLATDPAHAERLSLPMHDADIAALAEAGRPDRAREFVDESVFLPASAPTREILQFASDLRMPLLVSDAQLAPAELLTYTPGALTTIDLASPTDAIATHSVMSSALAGNLVVGDNEGLSLDDLDSRQTAVALSAVHYRQRPNDPRPVAIVTTREVTDTTRQAALALLEAPWVAPSGLSDIADGDPSPIERVLDEPDTPLYGTISAADLDQIDEGLAAFERLATVFDDSAELTAEATDRADRLLSVAWRGDPSGRNARIIGLTPTDEQMEAITVNTSSTINMISESSALPIQVTNEFSAPVDVVVYLETPDIRLMAPDPVPVHLGASTTASVSVPVQAHGSGNVDAEVYVLNEAGDLVGSPDVLHVRVRADWENVGTAVLAGAVGAVFIFGLVRSIRDGRRSEPIEPNDFVAASRQ